MKKQALLALAIIFTCGGIFAQSKAEKEVSAAVETFRKAMLDADSSTLARFTDKGLSYGHSSGIIQDKASFIENIINGNSHFLSIDLSDQTIRVSGNTAIVRHILSAKTDDKGKGPGTVKLGILTVWQKQHGIWVLLARQAVKL